MPLTPATPTTTTPGEPALPHGFYATPEGWGGLDLATDGQALPLRPVFEVPGPYDALPVRWRPGADGQPADWPLGDDGEPLPYAVGDDPGRLWNPEGRIFGLRLNLDIEADEPSGADVVAFAAVYRDGRTLGAVLTLDDAMAIERATEEPYVRVSSDVGGSLGVIVSDDRGVPFGPSTQVRTIPYFGGATMRQNGASLALSLRREPAAAIRVTAASLLIEVRSSPELVPAGS